MCFSKSQNKLFCLDKRNSFLHRASRYSNNPNVIRLLVDNGENVNGVNEEGERVADYAQDNENPDILLTLLELGMLVPAEVPHQGAMTREEIEVKSLPSSFLEADKQRSYRGYIRRPYSGQEVRRPF